MYNILHVGRPTRDDFGFDVYECEIQTVPLHVQSVMFTDGVEHGSACSDPESLERAWFDLLCNEERKPLAGVCHRPIQPLHVHRYLLLQTVVSGTYYIC